MRAKKVKQPVKYQYLGETDPAQFIHSNKFHRSASEAFRDATYACSIQTFKGDAALALDFLANAFLGFVWLFIGLGLPVMLVYWLARG